MTSTYDVLGDRLTLVGRAAGHRQPRIHTTATGTACPVEDANSKTDLMAWDELNRPLDRYGPEFQPAAPTYNNLGLSDSADGF